ncbi:Rho guanine nucleotide exchange factor [Gossypium australe]|uniref:Rho guanine nucleotide exchange factor n=1 Tax=Gossypium australe TaxID=47621 RepID=A0A5B6WZQ1_9ROSI|nr:Rho guanine nucleotide exchange factor [Gossypium australe]
MDTVQGLDSVVKAMVPRGAYFVPNQQFNMFHNIDRELYAVLVMNLCRDPVESLHCIALWLWLERVGFKKVVTKLLSLPRVLVNELADEALACLGVIHNEKVSPLSTRRNDTPLMQRLIDSELALPFFAKHRLIAVRGLAKLVNEVCMRALKDIMQQAVERKAHQSLADLSLYHQQQQRQHPRQVQVQPPLAARVPTPAPPRVQFGSLPAAAQTNEVHPDDRTIFVTFSKGYLVHEWEVREFFTKLYGNCIESLHMQDVMPNEQPLFARIVCHSPAAIEYILNGNVKAKFTINGKHVWARKFVPKRPKPASPAPPPPPFNLPVSLGI